MGFYNIHILDILSIEVYNNYVIFFIIFIVEGLSNETDFVGGFSACDACGHGAEFDRSG